MMKPAKLLLLLALMVFLGESCSTSTSTPSHGGCVKYRNTAPSKSEYLSSVTLTAEQGKTDTTITAGDTLFTIISNPSLSDKQEQALSDLKNSYNDKEYARIKEVYIIQLNPDIDSLLKHEKVLFFPVSGDSVMVAGRTEHHLETVIKDNGSISVFGYISYLGTPPNIKGTINLEYSKTGLTGTIALNGRGRKWRSIYNIRILGDGLEALIWSQTDYPIPC